MTVRSLWLLCSLGLVACATTTTAPPPVVPAPAVVSEDSISALPAPDPAVPGEWVIEQARGAPLLDKSQARLRFGPGGILSGHTGCNTLLGRYTLAGQTLKIGAIGTTRRACSEVLMEQEDRVLSALERAARAAVPVHGYLTLWDADGAVLLRASRVQP